MSNFTEYFKNNPKYTPTYFIGDRVCGKYKGYLFLGTVGNDALICEEDGPRVTVHLDLPLKIEERVHNIIAVDPKSVKRMKLYG